MEQQLHHERLDVYQVSIQFLAIAVQLAQSIPRGYSALADQLRRASTSVPLNIAEGYGKRSLADRARYYDIARGSAHECAALVDVLTVLEAAEPATLRNAKGLLLRIVSMLVKMAT